MKISLEVYLPFRAFPYWRGDEEIAFGTTPRELLHILGFAERTDIAMLVNGRYPKLDAALAAGDIVTLVRRSEGG